jgi:hypothetical protein
VDCKKIALLPGVPTPNILPGVPTPEHAEGLLPGVPTPEHGDGFLPGVPTPKILPGVPTPKYLDGDHILPGVPTPKYLEKKNATTINDECFQDIQAVVGDALDAAHLIEEANKAMSIERVLEAVKEVRKVETDLSKVEAACSCGEMKKEVLRTPCAQKVEFALNELFAMEKDMKAIIDGDITRAFAMEHEIAQFPALALEVQKACHIIDMEAEAADIMKKVRVRRRDFGWGLADKLKELASSASTKIHKEAAEAACFGSSLSIVKDIQGLAGTIGESLHNMTFHGMQDADHLHSHVSNALVWCQKATIA